MSRQISTSHPTKRHVFLYWRDSLELLEYLLNNPNFANAIELVPYRLYKTANRLYRVYTEWMSGNDAWEMQVTKFSFRENLY
jgi:Plavaka transposase